jgi:hypothetical protein
MANRRLCFDLWTIRQISTDEIGQQEHWDQNDTVDYHQQEDNAAPPSEAQIERYENEQDLFNDLKNFAGNLVNSFFSLAF